ncbi:MAG: acyl-CoA reductase [Candidatus Asgardarchaeia archaeon]
MSEKILNGYYLPDSLSYLEDKLEFHELAVDGFIVKVPKISKEHILEIVSVLKKNRDEILSTITIDEVAETYDRVSKKWADKEYQYKKIAMELLPRLTNLSPELIEFFQFSTLYKIDVHTIKFLASMKLNAEFLKTFIALDDANAMLRGFASFTAKMKLLSQIKTQKEIKLVTYITPKNVPGLIEALGIFLSTVAKASSITKTPSAQPVFAPLFARSICEVNKDIGETMVVVPWKGGTLEIEDVLFKNSDAVSIVSSTETVNSVRKRIDVLRKKGYKIKGCYHGGKFGLVVVSKEYATKDVALLATLDAIGYEGYMCSSPAFGFFVERGGELSPEQFAGHMVDAAEKLGSLIPQTQFFRKLREKELAHILVDSAMNAGVKIINTPSRNATVVYYPKPKINPNGQNRLIKVMPINNVHDVFDLIRNWRDYYQTIGVAMPHKKLLKFAEKAGKLGFSNIRVIGTVTLPRLGEAWDGNLPVIEFFIEDIVHWISINTRDIDNEISKLTEKIQQFIETKEQIIF